MTTRMLGFADPPYLGGCGLYNHDHGDDGWCWDHLDTHARLLVRLEAEFDGWAYCMTSTSLAAILPLAPVGTRVAAWAKPFVALKPNVRIAYAWEPVLFKSGRGRTTEGALPGRDYHLDSITTKQGVVGAKPERFCQWVLDLLGYLEGDELVDLYPGTGVMGRVLQANRDGGGWAEPEPTPVSGPFPSILGRKPRLLDLFCGAGGAAVGYDRAGFEVVGVDTKRQRNYPFEFYKADALTFPLEGFDVIHASPPCELFSQVSSTAARANRLTPIRDRLTAEARVPWVIECLPGTPMRADVLLCGSHFGLKVQRHRWFEFDTPPNLPDMRCRHDYTPIGVHGHPGGKGATSKEWEEAMGIDWMSTREITQAIPPAYSQWIGERLLERLVACQVA